MRKTRGRIVVSAAWLSLAACATHPSPPPQDDLTRNTNVDQRMLMPESGDGGEASVARYELKPTEVFRMPQPLDAGNPELPADSPRQALAPTTVCARVIVNAAGGVQRAELLNDRGDCNAGGQPENADLLQATLAKVQQWHFEPAAVCHFAADKPPADNESCDGAQRVEPVPVTLLYAFTFQVEQGRVHVERAGMGGH
ncbi:hypothetical protein [Pseudoxanthomonas sp.]|uniref:hypothetical protein n=1 Tax=Pseudoxanthomonas sp. TaxID=1871049 RepID=UPI00262551B9|nr:hypothetical protein [Pseudoxanthomonas sp.]WDS37538.1 MAG: hypothetical protein O8I58_06620 [Pseudoxanthomonas sp.]